MRRPPLAGFALSAVAHLIAVTMVILVVTRTTSLPPLFIDLTTATEPADQGRTAPSAADARPPAEMRASLPARASVASRMAAGARPTLRAPAVDLADPTPRATPAPLSPPRSEEWPSSASDGATVAPRSETPIVTGRSADAAADEITSASSSPRLPSADALAPSARRLSGGGESATAADAVPSGGGAGARAGQGLALATPGASGLGTGGGAPGAEYGEYLARFRRRIQESLRYPMSARRRELTGTVHLEVTIQLDGTIESVTVVQSSSHTALDEAALETVRSLRREPFPKGVTPRVLQVRVPVVFELR